MAFEPQHKNCAAKTYSKMSSGAGVTAAEVDPCNALVETGEFHCK